MWRWAGRGAVRPCWEETQASHVERIRYRPRRKGATTEGCRPRSERMEALRKQRRLARHGRPSEEHEGGGKPAPSSMQREAECHRRHHAHHSCARARERELRSRSLQHGRRHEHASTGAGRRPKPCWPRPLCQVMLTTAWSLKMVAQAARSAVRPCQRKKRTRPNADRAIAVVVRCSHGESRREREGGGRERLPPRLSSHLRCEAKEVRKF